ncbi:hypothetical protein [Sphingomonas sp. S6]|uniref:hypothetical protein n=1 Tax=Sphingomonas sp. S6 TaxID=3368600 RepID=UPI00373DEEA0
MIGWRTKALIAAIALLGLLVVAALVGAHRKGEQAGADHVTVQVQRDHAAAVTVTRKDERAAVDASATIATSVAQQTVASAAVTHHIVENLRHALDTIPPAPVGDPLPAAPIDGMRDDINTAIARANRAAEAAAAVAGAGQDGAS